MKKVQLDDFLQFKFLSNLNVSKDGSRVLYVKHTPDKENDNYQSDIEMIDNNKTISLTSSHDVSGYVFLDNDTIIFPTTREKSEKERLEKGEEFTSFYKLPLTGGESVKAFEIPYPVSKIEKLNDDEYILLIGYDTRYGHLIDDGKKEEMLKKKDSLKGFEVLTSIPFVMNGGGYTNKKVTRLYRYNSKEDKLTPLTDPTIDVYDFEIHPANDKLLFIASKAISRPTLKESLWEVNLSNNNCTELVEEKAYSMAGAFYYKDNILFMANKEVTHGNNENIKFFLYNKESNAVEFLINPDMSTWNSVGSDCRYGGGRSQKVVDDKFYFLSTVDEFASLYVYDGSEIKKVHSINGSIDCFDIFGDTIYYVGMNNSDLQEVYKCDSTVTKLSNANTALKDKYVAKPQEVLFENDGINFKGWVLLPYDYNPNKSYPAILDIHGGPKTVYGTVYYHEMQAWASLGYFVFFTNPRGSDGRGNDFMNIFGKYGTIDYDDLMKFTDVVLDKYQAIDKSRVGVTGGSYGGFMTNWIITHTNRFSAAATQRSISNWISMYGTSDIGFHFTEDQNKGNVWDTPEKLWEHSPLKYVKNVKTPTLIIHSDEDYRCPEEQGKQFFTALVDLGVKTRMVLFHGENHELSRSGKPNNRLVRLQEISDWMNKYTT